LIDFKPKQPVFLCGMMGSGKSTVGRILAKQLSLPFHDLDEIIERVAGISIPDIFKNRGEEGFRKLEKKCLLEVVKEAEGVIALGGGALQNQMIVDHIKLYGWLVFIRTPIITIVERLHQKDGRPMVDSKNRKALEDRISELLAERLPFYEQAPISIQTGDQTPEEAAKEIIKKLAVYEG
jgi:shikimate kinase